MVAEASSHSDTSPRSAPPHFCPDSAKFRVIDFYFASVPQAVTLALLGTKIIRRATDAACANYGAWRGQQTSDSDKLKMSIK